MVRFGAVEWTRSLERFSGFGVLWRTLARFGAF